MAVLNAIESDRAEINQSQSGTKNLGNDLSWYDEEVKTIVIRRYSTTPVTIRGIVAQDKLDFAICRNALNSGDIIINKAYISGADFVVPNSTTSDFGL